MNVITKLCENLIAKGRIQGMNEKLSQLLLFNQISQEDYARLMKLLEGISPE